MKTMNEVRAFFQGDRFATAQGIVIDSIDEDSAVCSVTLREDHTNANGVPQGGLIFTLADFCFAVAANHETRKTVTLDSTIHFLRPAKGTKLIAAAVCRNRTRRTCLYEVNVSDDLGVAVACATITGFTTG